MNNFSLIAIVEHKVNEHYAKKIISKITPLWEWSTNYESGTRGRIWLIWDPNTVYFQMEYSNIQYIHGKDCLLAKRIEFSFTSIYGLHTIGDRRW